MRINTARLKIRTKRIGALFICAALLLGLPPAAFMMNAGALSGKGTSDNPYIVTTWDEFDQLMRLNEGKTIYIELGNDIEWRLT